MEREEYINAIAAKLLKATERKLRLIYIFVDEIVESDQI